ncbi:hypothetical protein GQX74_001919 [Glossina fuscipes]|nr:hypothetical protein GQX74_001919 [Glossina fuscipes]
MHEYGFLPSEEDVDTLKSPGSDLEQGAMTNNSIISKRENFETHFVTDHITTIVMKKMPKMERQARQADKLVAGVYGEHAVLMQFAADLTLLLHYIACGEQRLFWFDLGLGYVWYGNKSSWYEVKVGYAD